MLQLTLGWTARLHPTCPETGSLAVTTPDVTLQKLVQLLILAQVTMGDVLNINEWLCTERVVMHWLAMMYC